MVLAYWKDETPTRIRNQSFDFPPSLNPQEFKPPTAIKRKAKSISRPAFVEGENVVPSVTVEQTRNSSDQPEQAAISTPETTTQRSNSESQGDRIDETEQNDNHWAYAAVADFVMQAAATIQGTEADDEWLKEIVKNAKTGLQQFQLQARLLDSKMTPNAALLKFAGSSNLTIEQVGRRRSEFLTTYGLNIISVQPEPGVVSIAIERPQREVVDLASVWQRWSPEKTEGNQNIAIAVRENDGSILYLDPSQKHAPHTLIAGSTGSGKSVLMQNILLGIAATNTPQQAEIVLIDPKQGVDYFQFEELPHLGGGVIVSDQVAITRLQNLVVKMDARYTRFRNARANNITAYNAKVDRSERMPTIWLIHDEFAEWMMVDEYKEEVSTTVQRLGVKARAAGIHLIFAAQRPDANVMPMQLRANLGNRLILRVDGEGTSEIALGDKGAEKLLRKGHLLAKLEGESGLVYAQVPLASAAFVDGVIRTTLP